MLCFTEGLFVLHTKDLMSQSLYPMKLLNKSPDQRLQRENAKTIVTMEKTTSISSEIDQILNQEFEISTSLSEFNYMLRQLDADETVPPPNYTGKETETWTVLDSFGTIAMSRI